MSWARTNVVPIAVLERTAYHADEVGQNARFILEAMRREADRLQAQASETIGAGIAKEGARHTAKWTATVASQAQVDVRALLADDDLVKFLSIKSEQANALITNLSTDVMQRIERETLGAVFEGRSNAAIAKSLTGIEDIGRNRAVLIARDQASKLNAGMNQFRQEQAGISHFKWRTILDGRERPTHHANNNKIFSWDKPPAITGFPGHDINCRCRALAIITDAPEDLAVESDNPDSDLTDFFQANLPLIREVAPTPSLPVFAMSPDAIDTRLSQVRELIAAVETARAAPAFVEADAERLVVELYGFKPSQKDIDGLFGSNVKVLLANQRTKLIEASKARLDLIESLLRQAAVNAANPSD